MNNHIWIPTPSKLDQIRVFGRKFSRKNSGKGLQQYGINYVCDASREAYMRNYRDSLEISICDHDLGLAAIRIGKEWHLAYAIQPGFDGVDVDNWLCVSRELRQKNKDKAELKYASVQRALERICEIDRLAFARASIRPKPITAAQENEYYERQFIGLSVSVPKKMEEIVRNDGGLLGTVIEPKPIERDLRVDPTREHTHNLASYCDDPAESAGSQDQDQSTEKTPKIKPPRVWRFDDE